MSLDYIRSYYSVPAFVGGRVEYSGGSNTKLGTIYGSSSAHLMIKLDGEEFPSPFHPTWKIKYLPEPKGISE